MAPFEGKKFVLLGERDGIAGPVMETILKSIGCEVVFSVTECFV
ncbi:Glycine/sarcosine/betaine reductase complex component A [bioreactor metagenome]|uniref:Glycine/sarcosine/betaine reductase complex component A n=2 Tax=root TaxID=1 RepID=A0A645CV29_9ZZZZ